MHASTQMLGFCYMEQLSAFMGILVDFVSGGNRGYMVFTV